MGGARLKALILGGYGTFGGRLAELLSDEPRLEIVIAGRSLAKAQAFCEELPGTGSREAVAIDRNGELAERFAEIAPDIVVDASGPFQVYGNHPYRVVEAALAAGADYLDLADSSAFVRGIERYDDAAKAAGRFVLSGMSSFPALSSAVARELARGLSAVDEISAGVAPSPYAGVGRNVIRAIASYAGKPVAVRRDAVAATAYPLTETRTFTIAAPGVVPLAPTVFSLVDVPDLVLLADLWPGVESVWVGAGPRPAPLHTILRGLARCVRRRVLPTLAPFAPLISVVINHVRWGEDRGGMFVEIIGRDAHGARVARTWHLVAEGEDGALIPSMAAETIVRRTLDGNAPGPGARAGTRELALADFAPAFARRAIVHGVRDMTQPGTSLFERVLGAAWDELPYALQKFHGAQRSFRVSGRANVERGAGRIANLAARVFGFPRAADDVALKVRVEVGDDCETWRRNFGKDELESVLYAGAGRFEGLLCERFGRAVFGMALVVENGRLEYVVRRWSWLGIPLPLVLAPRCEAYEQEVDGRFRFYVGIEHRALGPIVTYEGNFDLS